MRGKRLQIIQMIIILHAICMHKYIPAEVELVKSELEVGLEGGPTGLGCTPRERGRNAKG